MVRKNKGVQSCLGSGVVKGTHRLLAEKRGQVEGRAASTQLRDFAEMGAEVSPTAVGRSAGEAARAALPRRVQDRDSGERVRQPSPFNIYIPFLLCNLVNDGRCSCLTSRLDRQPQHDGRA